MRRPLTLAARCSRLRSAGCTSNGSFRFSRRIARLCGPELYWRAFSSSSKVASHANHSTVEDHARIARSGFSDSTIYALSTASGRAGIAVIRISGPACLEIYKALCPGKARPKPRYASVRTIFDPASKSNVLDSEALVLYFPAPKTVTGEEVLELHTHGGAATVKAVLAAIPRCSAGTIRYAEAGEFTRRAFQNDRLDLAQVEALSDTLSAETELQRRAAVRGNSGNLGRTYESWRHQLLYARGEVEAFIDFYEDQDFDTNEAEMLKSIEDQIRIIQESITIHTEASHRGELLRKGIRISMLGPPNAGKSSLLNRIVGREASIVSAEAGTTRDIVEVSLDIEGYLCTFADTAGLRSFSLDSPNEHDRQRHVGEIEAEGIRRAKAKAKNSDVIVVFAAVEKIDSEWRIVYDPESLEIASQAQECVVVVNKKDRVSCEVFDVLFSTFKNEAQCGTGNISNDHFYAISCKTAGVDAAVVDAGRIKLFIDGLVSLFTSMTTLDEEDLYGVTERQNQLLKQCRESLDNYLKQANGGSADEIDIVLAAEYLRTASDCLSRITGRGEAGDVEEVLGVVFEKFCVGK